MKYSIVPVLLVLIYSCSNNKSNISEEKKSASNAPTRTETSDVECLVGYDWLYPSSSKPTGAWKFLKNGSFNSSTTLFGGMSTWGNWEVIGLGKIKISYTRTTEGVIPEDQILILTDCNTLKVGQTNYHKY